MYPEMYFLGSGAQRPEEVCSVTGRWQPCTRWPDLEACRARVDPGPACLHDAAAVCLPLAYRGMHQARPV
jgi:hypothetical protein